MRHPPNGQKTRTDATTASAYEKVSKIELSGRRHHCKSSLLSYPHDACAARLGETGACALEIMAITGLRTSKEVVRYTRAARQRVLGESAMARLTGGDSVNEVVPPEGAASNNGTLLSRKEMNCQESEMNMVPGAHLNYSPNSLV
jgi:hypothetical protein